MSCPVPEGDWTLGDWDRWLGLSVDRLDVDHVMKDCDALDAASGEIVLPGRMAENNAISCPGCPVGRSRCTAPYPMGEDVWEADGRTGYLPAIEEDCTGFAGYDGPDDAAIVYCSNARPVVMEDPTESALRDFRITVELAVQKAVELVDLDSSMAAAAAVGRKRYPHRDLSDLEAAVAGALTVGRDSPMSPAEMFDFIRERTMRGKREMP